jgi:hypothetical protein
MIVMLKNKRLRNKGGSVVISTRTSGGIPSWTNVIEVGVVT